MEDVPFELLAIIFRNVVAVQGSTGDIQRIRDWMVTRLVCKKWNLIARDPDLVPPPNSAENFTYMAMAAEQSERYSDMASWMKDRVQLCADELSVEERNLLSVAYKNLAGPLRSSWRIVSSIQQKEESKTNAPTDPSRLKLIGDYLKKVEGQMCALFEEVLSLIERDVLPRTALTAESRVFYLKMKADYSRYYAEISSKEVRKHYAQVAENAYLQATAAAESTLKASNPVRLGLALNFAVFCYEILNLPDKSCDLAKTSFDNAIAELDTLTEEEYKDTTLLMQLVRDGMTLWTSDTPYDDSVPEIDNP